MTEVHPTEEEGRPPFKRIKGRWDYVRVKMKRRGLVEVNSSHPHHSMLLCLQQGISQILSDYPEHKPKDILTDEDYSDVLRMTVKCGGKTAVIESYASAVFASLRRAVHITEDDFLHSVAPPGLPYLEFISNSRSGQDFYFSNNQRFIIKTDQESCIQFFISILREYLNHFLTYPHSLLVKFVGLYSIKMSPGTKKYMLVMQSIFYPTSRVQDRFDIKGCLCNRYQKPNAPGKVKLIVLKDQNFLDQKIELGSQRDWFVQQLQDDVQFLRFIGVQDYSLLLARHPINPNELKESVGNLVLRMRKSFGHLVPDDKEDVLPKIPEGVTSLDGKDSRAAHSSRKTRREMQGKTTSVLRSLCDSSYLDATGLHLKNRRLLLNCKNSLHIIEGDSHRYFVGIIDFFTQWQCRQKVGKVFKDVKHRCKDHSTEPPDVYADRFLRFIIERTS